MKSRRDLRRRAASRPRIPHVSWRDGRPRFTPGPKLRQLGFAGQDLKRPDGGWMNFEEAAAWSQARRDEIAVRRAGVLRQRPRRGGAKPPGMLTIADMFEQLWRARRIQPAAADAAPDRRAGRLSATTVADYKSKARVLADFDSELFNDPAAAVTRGIVLGLHERLWDAKGLAMANGIVAVLRLAFSHVIDRELLKVPHPALKLKLPAADARIRIGTPTEIAALIAAADGAGEPEIADAIVLALYTCQRRGDVLALAERASEVGKLRFVQSKTGAKVRVRALQPLVDRLEAMRARHHEMAKATLILDGRTGKPFVVDTFTHRFAEIRALAAEARPSLATLRFADLRDTGVTRLALAGCTVPEICSVSGHSPQSIQMIMRCYLELDEAIADNAIDKLEAWLDKEGIDL